MLCRSSAATLLISFVLLITGNGSKSVFSNGEENEEIFSRTKRQLGSQPNCATYYCRALLNRIQAEGQYSSLSVENVCENNYNCRDAVDVRFSDGYQIKYYCTSNGCSEEGGTAGYSSKSGQPMGSSYTQSSSSSRNGYESSFGANSGYAPSSSINGYESSFGASSGYAPSSSRNGYESSFGASSGYAPSSSRNGYAPSFGASGSAPSSSIQGYAPSFGASSGYAPSSSRNGYAPSFGASSGYAPPSSRNGYAPSFGASSGYAPSSSRNGYAPSFGASSGYAPTSSRNGYAPSFGASSGYAPSSGRNGYAQGYPQTPSYVQSDTCLSYFCQNLVNRINKSAYHDLAININSNCTNDQCSETVSMLYDNRVKQIFDCDRNGCALRGGNRLTKATVPEDKISLKSMESNQCSTEPCVELINKLKSEVAYSDYLITPTCDGDVCNIDTVFITYSDNTMDVFVCNTDVGCQLKGLGIKNAPLPDENDHDPFDQSTTEQTQTSTTDESEEDHPKPENSLTSTELESSTTYANGDTTTAETPSGSFFDGFFALFKPKATNETTASTTPEPTSATITTTEPTPREEPTTTTKPPPREEPTTTTEPTPQQEPTTPTEPTPTTTKTYNNTPATQPTGTNVVKQCAEDSDCGGHHICFNGCIDPCEFCGKNALCDVIQKTYACKCPDNMEGDPDVECRLKANFEVLNTTLSPRTNGSGCVLPSDNSKMSFCPSRCVKGCEGPGTACHLQPGTATLLDTVRVQCQAGHGLDDERLSLVPCHDGAWLQQFPKCLALCPALKSDTMEVKCRLGKREVDCVESVKPGTRAEFECRPSHSQFEYQKALYKRGIVCKEEGRWSHAMPECKPDCGLPISYSDLHPEIWMADRINDGELATLGMYPWHAGLYEQGPKNGTWEYICGGSLVTSRVVVTAAHCIATLVSTKLQVALGKVYRSWDAEENTRIRRKVVRIEFPREFNTGLSYTWDVGLLLLDKPVQISRHVMPVCHNARYTLDTIYDSPAFVAGWGSTLEDPSPELLQHTNFSIIDTEKCKRQVPRALSGWDRFCGAKNTSALSVAEKGDSGGGVTAIFDNKHFIVGVVSVNYQNTSIFTNVTYEYIEEWMNRQLFNFEVQFKLVA